MLTMTVRTEIKTSGLDKLMRQLKNASINVGYINSPNHWNNDFPVAQLASHLHYWSPWRDQFMLSQSKSDQVKNVVISEMGRFGNTSFDVILENIGVRLRDQIKDNIIAVSIPPNSESWANEKGFNDLLRHGSMIGQEPNLISELTFEVVR